MDVEQLKTTLTFDNLITFLVVLVVLALLFILYANLVEAKRKLKLPKEKKDESHEARMETCDKRFASDQRMLIEHGTRISALEEGSRVQCRALHALLEHELHNGNSDEMQKASNDLFDHLNGK